MQNQQIIKKRQKKLIKIRAGIKRKKAEIATLLDWGCLHRRKLQLFQGLLRSLNEVKTKINKET